ncbi:PEP/pyruvate-binding domain-containing protein [Streptomyces antibioticus]|uniref:PEP/pyruvate-binding domain-containing protein n=1 Tax=Streptomyces antibioticus TaxID=1890 RepID=UPI0036F849FA
MTTLDERHGDGAGGRDVPGGEAVLALAEARDTAAVPLDDPGAALPRLTGSKAANLARAARAGLPVLPGFVIPHGGGGDTVALRRAWDDLSDGGTRPLVVRSSSPQEDTEGSSLAGRFASVLDVRGWPAFRAAVRTVLDSARLPDGSTAPMAVLVQPMLGARAGGVMFGADPVTGRTDRMLVSAVHGGPDTLVGGERTGTGYRLSARGRLLRTEQPEQPEQQEQPEQPERPERPEAGHTLEGPPLTRAELARLVRLARRARKVFGGPQDIEFGFDTDGRLWLFQSRPITATAARPARGARLLGPGPVAETLPARLTPLEEDLWVTPMAHGLAAALDIGGTAPRRLLRTVPVVRTVGGRAAADLRLLGAARPRHPWLALLNPAPGARRLAAAWRVGRLGTALPGLATDLVADVDRRLAGIPAPAGTPSPALVAELRWTRRVLVSLHAQEALAGALLPEPPTSRTAAGAALTALAAARARGVPDAEVIAAEPVVLALTAPSLRGRPRTPDAHVPGQGDGGTGGEVPHRASEQDPRHADRSPADAPTRSPVPGLPPREALRLRIRWVQELQVRLAREAARRTGLDVDRLALLRWTEVAAALEGGPLPADVHTRVQPSASPPLPDAFRLAEGTEGEVVVAEHHERHGDGDGDRGLGASRGRAVGTAWDGTGPRPPDAVLVVRTLDPALAPLLPDLTGLVAQTGSPLSHLAVLAREFGLPAVVGAAHAVRRFPPGSRLSLDGATGDVRAGEAP